MQEIDTFVPLKAHFPQNKWFYIKVRQRDRKINMIPTCSYDTTQSHTVCFCIWTLRRVIQTRIHLRNFSVRKVHAEQEGTGATSHTWATIAITLIKSALQIQSIKFKVSRQFNDVQSYAMFDNSNSSRIFLFVQLICLL